MFEIRNLKVNYGGIEAVRDISFSVPDGSIVTLIGANGAGKSTTLRTIAGLVNTAGSRLTFRPLDPPMTADLVFAHKKSRPLSRPAEAFLEAVRQEIARRS